MADQHIGYPGSVNSAQLALWLPNAATAQYHVEALEDGRVVINGLGDRGVTVKKGTIIGDGIVDVFENDATLNFAAVAPGSPDRWDMVVLRRTWNPTPGSSTSVYTIIQGGPNRSLPTRNNNKGVVSDQPMALCRLRAGATNVMEVVDLRTWAHNTGMSAVDKLTMNFMDQIGTKLDILGELWAYNVNKSSSGLLTAGWKLQSKLDHIQLGPVGASIFNATTVDQPFYIQAGAANITLSAQSYGRITWPEPFMGGLLTAIVTNGDSHASGGAVVNIEGNSSTWGSEGYGNKNSVIVNAYDKNGNNLPGRVLRVNYIAIGW